MILLPNFKELPTLSRREGGLWSAAGTLSASAGDSIGLALLGIVFRSMGLPESYPAARFVMWLMQHGLYDAVWQGVERAGNDAAFELRHMYVSQVLAQSLLNARPGFAADQRAARATFCARSIPRSTISAMMTWFQRWKKHCACNPAMAPNCPVR